MLLFNVLPISLLASMALAAHSGPALHLRHLQGAKESSVSKGHSAKSSTHAPTHVGHHGANSTTTTTRTETHTKTVYANAPSGKADTSSPGSGEHGSGEHKHPAACKAKHSKSAVAPAPVAAAPTEPAAAAAPAKMPQAPGPESFPAVVAASKPALSPPQPSMKASGGKHNGGHKHHGGHHHFSNSTMPAAAPAAPRSSSVAGAGAPTGGAHESVGPAPSASVYSAPTTMATAYVAPSSSNDLALIQPSGSWLYSDSAAAPAPSSDSVVIVYQTVDVVPVPASSDAPAQRMRAMRRAA